VVVDLDLNALLYAHATLCQRAQTHSFGKSEAVKLCDAINEFQRMLRKHLELDASDFLVRVRQDHFAVEPIGGWE
jgi:hypothetical protein